MGDAAEREDGELELSGGVDAGGEVEPCNAEEEPGSSVETDEEGDNEIDGGSYRFLERSPVGGAEDQSSFEAYGAPELETPLEKNARRVRKASGREETGALSKKSPTYRQPFTPEQRLLLLDTWNRSGLPATDFADLVGLCADTLRKWKSRFNRYGPAGLMAQKKGAAKGSRLPEVTKRMILMLKEANPEYGCRTISDLLARGPGVPASASAVERFLKEKGYEGETVVTEPHPDKKRRFERARPGQLWQTDLFTFTMKRQNRRVHLVAFMDDHSRFITGYGVHGSASTDMVIEALVSAVSSFGAPEELLTDNGPQYCTWRGRSRFAKECERLGIRQLVSRPRHPQTLGKIERFWGTLWRGFMKSAIFLDMEDARKRIGLFIDHYNFQRPHQSLNGLTPADRFFGAAPEVMAAMRERLEDNALELARKGIPKKPFYLTGRVDGKPVSVHEEGGRVFMIGEDGHREEVDVKMPRREVGDSSESGEGAPQCPDGSPPSAPAWNGPPQGRELETGLGVLADSLEKETTDE